MSQTQENDASQHITSPASLKRKRESAARTSTDPAFKAPKLTNGASHINGSSNNHQQFEAGDMLQGVGSASSLESTASSVFSSNARLTAASRATSIGNGYSPLTSMTESSPPKISPPRAATTEPHSKHNMQATDNDNNSTTTQARPSFFPPAGSAKGYRVVWDPELDGKLSKDERKRSTVKRREFGLETYEPDPPPDPRLAIPGYMSGSCRSNRQPSKAIWRIAPYNVQPYKLDKNSVGPGEAQQVVVVGFDPFLSEATLKLNFAQFGSIASVQNKTDPSTGSFLGIALVRFRDSASREDGQLPATVAAKRAETHFNGQRIGLHTVKVETDREGRKCKRYIDIALKMAREEREREHRVPPPPLANPYPPGPRAATTAATTTQATSAIAPPINAPRGPSGKAPAVKVPEGPRVSTGSAIPTAPRNPTVIPGTTGVEEEPILSKIKRKPYIYISNEVVPVLNTTIPHLKKRLKAYDWREVRLDRTGYYVVFEDSKRGEDETQRCFAECNKAALFTYSMEMQCQKYGNPNYERSPSPERAKAAKIKKEEYNRLLQEELEDIEIEKKNRAENLDPVFGALEQLKTELRDKIMSDVKMRIAIPIFHESLEPAKHGATRRKLGLPDPSDAENKAPALLFNKSGDTPPQTPRGRFGHGLSRPLRPHDPNQQRGRNKEQDRAPVNAFIDERRRRPAPRPVHARGLHFRLQQMFDEDDDSDEERRTSLTRDTEDQESRPLSRASRTSTPFDTDSMGDAPRKRRKITDADIEEREVFTELQRQLVGHLLHKEPEDLATRELELVVGTLPRTSKYAARARTELYMRQRARADDDLFQVSRRIDDNEFIDDMEGIEQAKDFTPVDADGEPIKQKLKKKRRTKKEIQEEKEALKAAAKRSKVIKLVKPDDVDDEDLLDVREREPDEVDLTVSFDKPHRTVEDEPTLILDVDGWQHVVKDDEDMAFLRSALADEEASDIGNAKFWAWKQKEIKTLNNGGVNGPVTSITGIEGYYVPNSTGCARTEGVQKILNEVKSKYLPHRIKVQKAREERQALAKANPAAAAEAAKMMAAEKIASTATSRSNRVNNRRLINDINLQKQVIATSNSDADVAIRFNQLKKRKKLVKFDRSAIHGWGLYAEENIAISDLIIEYVGEKVRQKVADAREIRYDKQGVGSSYLFRMIDDEIVDATKKGGIARFINHSCDPNCTAKIIKVEGTPRIVIYALKDILKNQELTYDYKFEREMESTDRIPCLCGSANCKGFLN